ncbi:hypothetical protein L6304_05475 [bacterium]|nr:hypothetical protein [bacterium]MCG2676607.1 hypothetical protein [bacterium]
MNPAPRLEEIDEVGFLKNMFGFSFKKTLLVIRRGGMNKLLKVVLCGVSGVMLLSSVAVAQPLERKSEVREDILILNLVNSLHLTKNQMLALMTKAREAEIKKKTFTTQLGEITGYSETFLKELRGKLMRNEELPKYLTGEVGSSQKRLHDLRDKYEEEMLKLAKDVTEILNENQLVMVDAYKPCIIPYRDLTHPERVGQAGATVGMERLLERIHDMPEALYQQRKEGILMGAAARLEKHTRKEVDVEKEKKRLAKIFDEARALSDLEFDLKKAELAQKILPEENKVKTEKERLRKIARFFLSPRIIPVLEEKLSQEK